MAAKTGCSSAYEAYYSCADSSFSCRGATSTFPGCDESLAALDRCLGAATSNTACVALTMAQTGCTGGPAPDAGVDGGPPPACTAARDCQARCYLNQVANVCAPRVDELENVTTCAASCPP